jgi:GNAT superfamily N-acetyltransferase
MQELGSPVDAETAARRLRAVGEAAGHEVLVAEAGGRVAGLAGLAVIHRLEHDRPSGRLTVLVVGPEARGRGVARALIGAIEARARAAGCARLEVTSSGDRPAAHAAYRAAGFVPRPERFLKELRRPQHRSHAQPRRGV